MTLDGNAVRSVDRAAALLLALGESHGEAGVTELARRLGLHKSTASRLLATLEKRGLVEQDDETGKYRLGIVVLRLAETAERTLDLRSIAMPELDRLAMLPTLEPAQVMQELYALTLRVVAGVAALLTVIALFDYVYQRISFLRSMRMSKQEVREEYKEAEGDPHIKGKLRQLRAERARRRMIAAVPDAAVVITNPTHFAVAL
jgi:DNA-binding transcriptional ArsR family regulator